MTSTSLRVPSKATEQWDYGAWHLEVSDDCEKLKGDNNAFKFCAPHTFVFACISAAVVVMFGLQLVAVGMWPNCQLGVPCEYRQSNREFMIDIINDRVPPMEDYGKNSANFEALGTHVFEPAFNVSHDCVGPWLDVLKKHLGRHLTSQPVVVQEIMQTLRLDRTTFGRKALGDLWSEPVAFGDLLDQTARCIGDNLPIHATLCTFLDDSLHAPRLADPEPGGALTFTVHVWLVLERLGNAAANSWEFRQNMVAHFAGLDVEIDNYAATHSLWGKFLEQKWYSVLTPTGFQSLFMDIEGGNPEAVTPLQDLLALNIIEAADLDREQDILENADYGLAIAASTTDMVPWVSSSGSFSWPFTKNWYDAYIAWNMNYVSQLNHYLGPEKLTNILYLAKLFIPSIVCTSEDDVREKWIIPRTVTLKASILLSVFLSQERVVETQILIMPSDVRRAAAVSSMHHSDIRKPSLCCGYGSLHRMWNSFKPYSPDLFSPLAQMHHVDFHIFYTVVAWITVVTAGLGSEIVCGTVLVRMISESTFGFSAWKGAQLFFALFVTVGFMADGTYGLPFLACGIWKFGFPETITYLLEYYAKGHLEYLIDGMGLLLHHLASSFIGTGMICHLFPRSRAMTAACLGPIVQHCFVLMKYKSKRIYIAVQLSLEVWFQCEVISNVADFHSGLNINATRLGRGLALTMIVSHWLFLIAAAIRLWRENTLQQQNVEGEPPRQTLGKMAEAGALYSDGTATSSPPPMVSV